MDQDLRPSWKKEEHPEDWNYLVYFTVHYLDYFEKMANEGDLSMTAV